MLLLSTGFDWRWSVRHHRGRNPAHPAPQVTVSSSLAPPPELPSGSRHRRSARGRQPPGRLLGGSGLGWAPPSARRPEFATTNVVIEAVAGRTDQAEQWPVAVDRDDLLRSGRHRPSIVVAPSEFGAIEVTSPRSPPHLEAAADIRRSCPGRAGRQCSRSAGQDRRPPTGSSSANPGGVVPAGRAPMGRAPAAAGAGRPSGFFPRRGGGRNAQPD